MEAASQRSKSTGPRPTRTLRSAGRPAGRKSRGLTCTNCRTKKIRCDGSQPTCKTCEVYHVECRYEKLPSMSQVLAMAQRLEEAEQTIATLQGTTEAAATVSTGRSSRSFDDTLTETESGPGLIPDTEITVHPVTQHPSHAQTILTPSTSQEVPLDLSVDANGKICYYGPTSAVHDIPAAESPLSAGSNSTHSWSKSEARAWLASRAKEGQRWEDFALRSAAIQSDIPRQVISKLLNIHWTWISPMFMWVYRPAFIQDMSTGGRYYSEFLLTVLCGHAARFYDTHVAEMLTSKARLLLGSAIQQPSSIPTVQALLQLSARELAYGSISQAWLYSGMAFRIAADLGLHHTNSAAPSLRDLNPVDFEVRRRLFWSCYFWDKYELTYGEGAETIEDEKRAMSLYTGRMPAIVEVPDHVDFEFLDDSSELEPWSPYCADSLTMANMAPGEYPIRRGHFISCFTNSCKLAIIIRDIIVQLYSRRQEPGKNADLERIKTKLAAWRAELPAHLQIDDDDPPEICPPPHILSQNLLYYACIILAHRPFWSLPVHYAVCIGAAQSIEKLLLLLGSTFGFDNITYLMAYCIYTGASALLQDARNGSAESIARIQTFIRALQTGARKCFFLQRSLDLINKGLRAPTAQPPPSNNDQATADNLVGNDFIPAFPYMGFMADDDYDVAGLSGLDYFPQMHMDF